MYNQPKLTFQESILIPQKLFQEMEEKLKEQLGVSSPLDLLKAQMAVPPDIRLKNWDFFKRFHANPGPKREIGAVDPGLNRPLPLPLPPPPPPPLPPLPSPPPVQNVFSSLSQHIKHITDFIIEPKNKMTAERILRLIAANGKGLISWNDSFHLMLDNERQVDADIREGISILLGEASDPNYRYYKFFINLLHIGCPPSWLKNYQHYDDDRGPGPFLSHSPIDKSWESHSEEETGISQVIKDEAARRRRYDVIKEEATRRRLFDPTVSPPISSPKHHSTPGDKSFVASPPFEEGDSRHQEVGRGGAISKPRRSAKQKRDDKKKVKAEKSASSQPFDWDRVPQYRLPYLRERQGRDKWEHLPK
jgi:hypothetical protein